MKYYTVIDEYLKKYKYLVDNYCVHASNCSINQTDFCNCGLTDKIRQLIQIDIEYPPILIK